MYTYIHTYTHTYDHIIYKKKGLLNYSLDNFLFNRERWTQYAQTR